MKLVPPKKDIPVVMASRKHLPPQVQVPLVGGRPVTRFKSSIDAHDLYQTTRRDDSRASYPASSSASSSLLPLSVLEDRIIAQDRNIQSLLLDNQQMAANSVALEQELADAKKEIRQLTVAAEEIKARKEAEVRDVYEKSLKLDAEVRAMDEMSAELVQVRGDVRKLIVMKRDLSTELQDIEADVVRARADSQKVSLITSEIEAVRREIERGRVAIEYEKKTCASNIQHGKVMDKNMVTMVAEIEKLRLERKNAEKRARAAASVAAVNPSKGPGYPSSYGNPELGNQVSYPDFRSQHQVKSVDANNAYAL